MHKRGAPREVAWNYSKKKYNNQRLNEEHNPIIAAIWEIFCCKIKNSTFKSNNVTVWKWKNRVN